MLVACCVLHTWQRSVRFVSRKRSPACIYGRLLYGVRFMVYVYGVRCMLHVAKATRGRGRNLQEKDARVEWRDTALVKAKQPRVPLDSTAPQCYRADAMPMRCCRLGPESVEPIVLCTLVVPAVRLALSHNVYARTRTRTRQCCNKRWRCC